VIQKILIEEYMFLDDKFKTRHEVDSFALLCKTEAEADRLLALEEVANTLANALANAHINAHHADGCENRRKKPCNCWKAQAHEAMVTFARRPK